MPKYANRELTQRKQVDPRDTFDYTTPNLDIVARPVDAYTDPGDQGLNRLISSLSAFNEGLSAFIDIKSDMNRKDEEAGALARMRGEAKPSDKGWAFIKGYEELDGKIAAQEDFKNKAIEYFEAHKNDNPEDFKKGWDELTKQFVQPGTSKYYLKGFSERALQVEESVMTSYTQYQQQILQDKLYTNLRKDFRDTVETETFKLLNISNWDNLLTNADKYTEFVNSKEVFKNAIAPNMRKALSEKIKKAKELGLSTSEISKLYFETVAGLATTYGMPELLHYAFLEDESKIAVIDTSLKEKVISAMNSAEIRQDEIIRGLRNAKLKQNEELKQRTTNEFYLAIAKLTPGDVKGAAELLSKLEDPKILELLEPSHMNSMATKLTDIIEGKAIAEHSDREVFDNLWSKLFIKGTLTYKEVLDHSNYLSEADIKYFANELQAKENERRNNPNIWFTHQREMDMNFTDLIDAVNPKGALGQYLFPDRKYKTETYLASLIRDFVNKNKREPQGEEWNQIQKTFFEKFPPGLQGLMNESKPKAAINHVPTFVNTEAEYFGNNNNNITKNSSNKKKLKWINGKLVEVQE